MKKSKEYKNRKYSSRLLREVFQYIEKKSSNIKEFRFRTLQVTRGEEEWNFDNFEEFLGEYNRVDATEATVTAASDNTEVYLRFLNRYGHSGTAVSVTCKTREQIESIHAHFAEAKPDEVTEFVENESAQETIRIFIGHGQDKQWLKLRDHLKDKHGFEVEC